MSSVVADQIALIISLLSGGFVFGFVTGYAVRAYLSWRHRWRGRQKAY